MMRFMGDQPKSKNQNDVQCILEILQVCDLPLGKVLKCQCPQFFLSHRESVLRGWLLLNLLTGYFLPSKILMPYATKFLQQAGSDPSSTHHGMAVYEERRGRKGCGADGILCVLLPKDCPLQKGRGARRLEISMPGGVEYIARIRTFTVVELSSLSQHQERQPSTLHKYIGKMVRPMRTEEYLHDYLLEDALVTVSLRRLIWKTPLHFENKIYIDVHYGQVSNKGTVSTRNLSSRGRIRGEASGDLKEYIPKPLQSQINPQSLQNHLGMLLRNRQQLQPLDAKIQFIGEETSRSTWVNPIILLLKDFSHVIPLKELQKMRTLRPTSDGGLPGIELNYGSAARTRLWSLAVWSCWLLLYHTVISLDQKSPSSLSDQHFCFLAGTE
uniref:MyTH4 domain-containing protein n=1 Tax=Anser brachyrhynchus TaxID=132585 RepID=A0A8B9I9Y0_9AVES